MLSNVEFGMSKSIWIKRPMQPIQSETRKKIDDIKVKNQNSKFDALVTLSMGRNKHYSWITYL